MKRRVFTLLIFIFSAAASGRPFDWYYNYLCTPFAVFYNPSLLGNNPGYTFGMDGYYRDESNYNARLAVVVPVSDVATVEDHLRNAESNTLKYANVSHKSSGSAVSMGGAYSSDDTYMMTAGFTTPVRYVQTGAAVNFFSGGNKPAVSVNTGASANILNNAVYLSLHNIWTNDRRDETYFGMSFGGAGVLYSDPRMVSIPLEVLFSFYVDDGDVNSIEGTARLTVDFTPILAGRERTGTTVSLSGGYKLVNVISEDGYRHSLFASLGVVFMGRSSSAAVFGGGHGSIKNGRLFDNDKHGAVVYSSFSESSARLFSDKDFTVDLKYAETDDGRIVFYTHCGNANIESWVLRIDEVSGKSISTFSGGNVIPSVIIWDKTDSQGKEILGEHPRAKLVVKGLNEIVVESEWVTVK